jgi:hypothetical protein
MHLVNKHTGVTINAGDVVHDFRGDAAIVTDWALPKHSASTGRVYVKEMNERGITAGYYPSVYNLTWAGTPEV